MSQRKNANNNTSKQSKKRKRQEKLQQYGVDLPDVPGVNVEIIPVLVHALKTATKFFQHQDKAAYNEEWEAFASLESDPLTAGQEATRISSSKSFNRTNNDDPLENVLHRLDASAKDADHQQQQQEQRKIKMKDAVQSWLQAVKRLAKDHHRDISTYNADHIPSHNNNPQGQKQQTVQTYKKSQPLCCFRYIWNLGLEHKRLAVRRAALYMNRHLLDKSADCRRFFLQDDNNLWDWVQRMATDNNGEQEGTALDATKRRLWQREGHYLLVHLLQQQYGDLYPKLMVSEQYLQQACMLELHPAEEKESDRAIMTTNMGSLRQLRDIAMEHSQEEMRRVQRLIQRCHKCMDMLVPRMGLDGDADTIHDDNNNERQRSSTIGSKKQKTAASNTIRSSGAPNGVFDIDDNAGDGEDDVDWEDGWEDEEDDNETAGNNKKNDSTSRQGEQVSHAQAVERTLQAMESIGVGYRTGGLEIDFDNNTSSVSDDPLLLGLPSSASAAACIDPKMNNTPNLQAARERFMKCAKFLSERHLPRIRAWLEGLQNADRLAAAASGEGSSLILMSPQQGKQRQEIRQQLMEIHAQVLSVLESAARLGLASKRSEVSVES